MRLSEAIRLGAMWRPQAFGAPFLEGGSCALGAAFEAIDITPEAYRLATDGVFDAVEQDERAVRAFPALSPDTDALLCPGCGCDWKGELIHLIPHLNDGHKWTRERIADFVETVESHPKPQAQAPAELSVAG